MITIIDYGLGNIGSLSNMFMKIGANVEVASDPEVIANADRLILPGVGAFDAGMECLKRLGLDSAIRHAAKERHRPLLGICLGMQLLGSGSEEGSSEGLGLIAAKAIRFKRTEQNSTLTIPHMGWNAVEVVSTHPLFQGLEQENRFYFVHSYYMECVNEEDVSGTTLYGHRFASSLAKANVTAVQFHPEKSHKFGMRLLKNFSEISYV